MRSAQASFQVSIKGNAANALYDSQLAESSIFLSFCGMNHIYHHLGVCNIQVAVAVEMSTWEEYFSCVMMLRVLDSISHPYNVQVILGYDWFTMCSTGLKDNPEAAVHLSLLDDQWLVFAASPVNAIQVCIQSLPSSTSKFYFSNGYCYFLI